MAKEKKPVTETAEPVDTSRPDENPPATTESTEDTTDGDSQTTEPVDTSSAPKTPSATTTVKNKGDGSEKSGKVRNVAMAGKSVYAVTGKPVEFDADGLATPDPDDLEQLLKVPGYEKA